MDPRRSFEEYPRKDTYYRSKSSFNFDVLRSKIFMKRTQTKCDTFYRWLSHMLIGMFTGTIAFGMATIEELLTSLKSDKA